MSAELLRRAAEQMRYDWPEPNFTGSTAQTFRAVADWLDQEANSYEANEKAWAVSSQAPENRWAERGLTVEANLAHHHSNALAVARAYLGES